MSRLVNLVRIVEHSHTSTETELILICMCLRCHRPSPSTDIISTLSVSLSWVITSTSSLVLGLSRRSLLLCNMRLACLLKDALNCSQRAFLGFFIITEEGRITIIAFRATVNRHLLTESMAAIFWLWFNDSESFRLRFNLLYFLRCLR